jgi:hypothetical protein
VCAAAAAQLGDDRGRNRSQTALRSGWQKRAVVLLHRALALVAAEKQRAYWRENVVKDAALDSIRRHPLFGKLVDRYGR